MNSDAPQRINRSSQTVKLSASIVPRNPECGLPEFITERPSSLDGRRERSTRSRHAIARAMLDLMRETQSIPTVDAVADRANVSRRSVFRHFPETNSLIIAAVDMQRTDVNARFAPRDLSTLGLPERVRAVSQRLGRMNEYITRRGRSWISSGRIIPSSTTC